MKINKDLVDAVMMLSFITLVLVGTTDFSNLIMKDVSMGILGVITVIMMVLRGIQIHSESKEEHTHFEY